MNQIQPYTSQHLKNEIMNKKNKWIISGDVENLAYNQQKQIRQGEKCGYSTHYNDPQIFCVDSAEEAERKAGIAGWWCCNCSALDDVC